MNKQEIEIGKKAKIGIVLVACAMGYAIIWVGFRIGVFSVTDLRAYLIAGVVGMGIMVPAHEGLHATFTKLFGGEVRVKVGFDKIIGLYAGVWSPADSLFTRRQFLMIALGPQLLSLGAFIVWLTVPVTNMVASVLFVAMAFNIAGGTADMHSAYRVLRCPSGSLIENSEKGLVISKE